MEWDVYEEWRGRERGESTLSDHVIRVESLKSVAAANFPVDAFPFLSVLLPSDVYQLVFTPLMHLLSRFAAHSHLSGLTPHTLSSLFAPLLFDIPTFVPAMTSHAAFVRAASATEHLLLAYIRSTASGKDGLGLSDLPFRLKEWVTGYPAMVASDADLARGGPRRGARVVRCERANRTVRAYSKDLVVQAELWAADIPGEWAAWDHAVLKGRRGDAGRAKFSPAWRRRMAIKEAFPLPKSTSAPSGLERGMSYGRARRPGRKEPGSGTEERDEACWGSLAGKEWSLFEEGGFVASSLASPEGDDMSSRLQFDLNESAKMVIHHILMWFKG